MYDVATLNKIAFGLNLFSGNKVTIHDGDNKLLAWIQIPDEGKSGNQDVQLSLIAGVSSGGMIGRLCRSCASLRIKCWECAEPAYHYNDSATISKVTSRHCTPECDTHDGCVL